MKIVRIEDLHADGGWRTLSYLKVTTDDGVVGWSEFNEGASCPGLKAAILNLAARVIGEDPKQSNQIVARLHAATRIFSGGATSPAIAAIENACLDIKAKCLGVPVYDLFGGAFRKNLPVYWSQCGTLRTSYSAMFDAPPLRSLDDVIALGREAKSRGYKALKTNVLLFEGGKVGNYRPGFGIGEAHPALNLNDGVLDSTVELLHAFREGAGPGVRLMLDLNFNVKPEGIRRIARALEPLDLMWLELDIRNPVALASLRQSTTTPIASLEAIFGRQAMRPYFDEDAVDVAIVDAQWNGMSEAIKMAHMAESYDVNVASHNYHGQLSTLIGAHFSAAIPNTRIVEFVADEAPWTRDFLTHPLKIEGGEIILPTRPGWGSDINEEALLAHPPRNA
ncbi:MAG: enolase [Herminiimonas sp.]|nr:enolase [Herminiimonas sp.]